MTASAEDPRLPRDDNDKRPEDPFFDVEKIAAATDCTGLAPAAVYSAYQGRDLSALYSIHRLPAYEDDEWDGEEEE